MIDYTFEEGRDVYRGESRDVWLFLGVSWRDDLPYRKHFATLDDEYDNFQFVPTLSRESYLSDWDGETEYIQHTFLKYLHTTDNTDRYDDREKYLDADPNTDIQARIDPIPIW